MKFFEELLIVYDKVPYKLVPFGIKKYFKNMFFLKL